MSFRRISSLFALLLALVLARGAHADTTAPAAPPAEEVGKASADADAGAAAAAHATKPKETSSDDAIPPEALKRLSPEQIQELLMQRMKQQTAERSDNPIVVPVAFFAMILAIVVASLYVGQRKDRQRHETLRLAIERGAAIPPSLLTAPRPPRSDLRRGILTLAVGIGLTALIAATSASNGSWHADGSWTLGLIPMLLGGGYLLVYWLDSRRPSSPPTDPGAGAGAGQ